MPSYLTLQQISQKLVAELLSARTDFLLRQTALWQDLNARAGESAVWAQPGSLDISGSRLEFFIRPRKMFFLARWFRACFGGDEKNLRFSLCGRDQRESVKVILNIRMEQGQQLKSEITTDPEMDRKPQEINVAGFTG